MIKDFTPRLYQETILATAVKQNTLVVLPTGMGKTAISMLLAAQRFKQYPNSKVLILAPTRPLVEQHIETFKQYLDLPEEQFAVFTGMIKPEKRQELWKTAKVIFSTPQGLENDIITGRINLEEVSLLVFDEAHRAVGDYAYVFVAKQYHKKASFPRILALTASPGSDIEKIKEVTQNLFIEEVEVRTDNDPDVKPYIKEINIEWIKVELTPPFEQVQRFLKNIIYDRTAKLKKWGILQRKNIDFVNKTDLLALQAQLRGRAASGEKDFVMWNAISVLAEIMKVQHGLELLETQGIFALQEYLTKLQNDGYSAKTKAVKNIVADLNFRSALIKTQKMYEQGFQHPKLIELQKLIEKHANPGTQTTGTHAKRDAMPESDSSPIKIIIFNQYRDNAQNIVEEINKINNIQANLFVGQQKKKESGLSQKQQKEMLNQFRNNKFNVLVATSVGEEGLDIPKVDLVIFYEPIPSAIRHIQRRGRTGRQEKGKVIILMTKNTRDEGYRWSAHHKEKRMYRNLTDLKSKLTLKSQRQEQSLEKYTKKEEIAVFADHREKGSGIIKELIDLNTSIKLEKLDTADYILSSRCGVELKTPEDFASSIIDGRLLEQIKQLKRSFECPLVIVEGEQDIYSVRNIHPNAVRGMLATIAISYKIPVLFTKNSKESASLLHTIAKREQDNSSNDYSMHADRKPLSLKEQQEYIISSLPLVGPSLAKELLKKFKTVKKVINAKEERLKKVKKIGDKKAKEIKNIVDSEYLQ
ncbi:DEAD/DEAH box helicase [Candidatus Woesearchaeota archaeon]|nr:DEAD/DEAH box helicase [Candidatus Woesearchaeota archaeon]